MLRGPLHNAGADGRCEACGEPFPCPTGLAIFEAVKHELEHPTPTAQPSVLVPTADALRAPITASCACGHQRVQHALAGQRGDECACTAFAISPAPPIEQPPRVRWEALDDREARCPRCLHWWVSHGVPGEDGYRCTIRANSIAEQPIVFCGCTFAEGNPVTPRQVRIWHDGTSWPLAPWDRATCGHARHDSRQCLDSGAVLITNG